MSDSCASCSGRCCYNIVIRITGIDVWRLSRGQFLPPEAIADAPGDEAGKPGAFLCEGAYRALHLTKSASVPAACTFLMHLPGDVRRCGVYAERPQVCAVYPMTIADGSVDIRSDVTCAPQNWNFATLNYAAWRRALARYTFEWSLYSSAVERWNARSRPAATSLAAFYAYVLDLFDRAQSLFESDEATHLIERWHDAAIDARESERRDIMFGTLAAHIGSALPS